MTASVMQQPVECHGMIPGDSRSILDQCSLFHDMTQSRPSRMVACLTLSAITILGAAIGWAWMTEVDLVVETSGQVRSKQEPVQIVNRFSSQWVHLGAGYQVDELLCQEGQLVEPGDVLVRFDCERLLHESEQLRLRLADLDDTIVRQIEKQTQVEQENQLQLNQALSALTMAQAELVEKRRQQKLNQSIAQTKLELARERYSRVQRLVRAEAASKEALSQAKSNVQIAQDELELASKVIDGNNVEAARLAVDLTRQKIDLRTADLRAVLQTHRAERNRLGIQQKGIESELKHAQLTAPIHGTITQVNVRRGATVQPGEILAVVTPHGERLVHALLDPEDIPRVKVGCRAKFDSDGEKGGTKRSISGRVVYVSPDAHPHKVEMNSNGSGGFTVHVELDSSSAKTTASTKLGMTGKVEVVFDRQPLLEVIARGTKSALSF